MQKIRSKHDARKLAEKLVEDWSVEITVWNSRKIKVVDQDIEDPGIFYIRIIDDINGSLHHERHTVSDLTEQIWANRRYINKCNQLAAL